MERTTATGDIEELQQISAVQPFPEHVAVRTEGQPLEKHVAVYIVTKANIRMKRKFGEDYNICPLTFILPEDYSRLCVERDSDAKALWIMKPVASSCGRGIRMIPRCGKIPKKAYFVHSYNSN